MRAVLLPILLLCNTLCIAQEIQERTFTPKELKADVNFLFDNLEQIHPNLYYYTPKSELAAKRSQLLSSLTQSIKRKEFATKLVPIVTALNDGHTGLLLPSKERSEFVKNGGLIFPVFIQLIDGKSYVKKNLSSNSSVVKNAEILAVNDIPMSELLASTRALYSGELQHFRDIRVEQSFGRMFWYLHGESSSYKLKLNREGEEVVEEVDGITLEEYRKQTAGANQATKPFTFKILDGSPQIGVIEFNTMQHTKRWKQFLDSTFQVIEECSIEHLVIDIRKNGGGNSELAHQLFDYITDKPYKLFESAEVKISAQSKKHAKDRVKWFMMPVAYPLVLFIPQARPYFYRKSGTTKTFTDDKLRTPRNVKRKFSGETYLLTSNYTFSSANALANAYKCYDMGAIVGQETGGVSYAFGDVITFQLPNTNLTAFCSHKAFLNPCHDGEVHGVIPDVVVKPFLQWGELHQDEEIKQVIQLIRGSGESL